MANKSRGTTAAVTVTSANATTVAAAATNRQCVRIYNSTGVTIYVALDVTATTILGETVLPGGFWSTEEFAASAVSVIAASGVGLTLQVTA